MQLDSMEPGEDAKELLRNQVLALRSGNRTAILEAIREIRHSGNISILPELFELLLDQEDNEIISGISSLLNDLKDQEAVQVLVEAIGNPDYQPITTRLVSACWQNGLSYGKYLDTFVNVAVHGKFETAIEAFTVIEEAIGDLDKEERNRFLLMVKHGLLKADEQKKMLLRELVKVIETY
jgi:hypothetical protein